MSVAMKIMSNGCNPNKVCISPTQNWNWNTYNQETTLHETFLKNYSIGKCPEYWWFHLSPVVFSTDPAANLDICNNGNAWDVADE